MRSMMSDAVHLVGRFVASRHPTAIAAILAGSRARAVASSVSDYDIVLLFESLPNGAWREMVEFEGQHVEVFAHDPEHRQVVTEISKIVTLIRRELVVDLDL